MFSLLLNRTKFYFTLFVPNSHQISHLNITGVLSLSHAMEAVHHLLGTLNANLKPPSVLAVCHSPQCCILSIDNISGGAQLWGEKGKTFDMLEFARYLQANANLASGVFYDKQSFPAMILKLKHMSYPFQKIEFGTIHVFPSRQKCLFQGFKTLSDMGKCMHVLQSLFQDYVPIPIPSW